MNASTVLNYFLVKLADFGKEKKKKGRQTKRLKITQVHREEGRRIVGKIVGWMDD